MGGGALVNALFCLASVTISDWVWNGKRLIQVSTEWEERKIIHLVNQYLVKLLDKVEKASQLMVELSEELIAACPLLSSH